MKPGLYNGNSKYLYEFLVRSEGEVFDIFWLSDRVLNTGVLPIEKKFKGRFFRRYSLLGAVKFLRSEVVVLSHGFGDMGLYSKAAKRKKVLQLWHGVGIKSMGALEQKFDDLATKRFFGKETRFYDVVISSSDIDRYYTASWMGVDIRKVVVTGLPRNDFLVPIRNVRKNDEKFKILYAPTFRDKPVQLESLFFPFSKSIQEVEEWAKVLGIQFLLRPHPNDKASLEAAQMLEHHNSDVFKDYSPEVKLDAIDVINECDGIITDYSSIYIDGLMRDVPCVFVDFDRQKYLDERGLAYDYELVTPGPKVQTWEGFKLACEEMLAGALKYAEKRDQVRALFFKYQDDSSCHRVADILKKMVH